MDIESYNLKEVGQPDGTSEVEILKYNPLPPTRTDLDYHWIEQTIDETLAYLGGYLKRNNAKAYIQDVYASNNQVYRNILIQLPDRGEMFPAEDIYIMFDRDKGKMFTLRLERR